MKTVIESLLGTLDELGSEVDLLLRDHSKIWKWTKDGAGFVVITPRPYGWSGLEVEGRRIQARLLKEWDRSAGLLRAVLRGAPNETLKHLESALDLIRECVDQSEATYFESAGEARKGVHDQLRAIKDALEPFGPAAERHSAMLAADTNALLFEPDLEKWEFDEIAEFELVLFPTVLQELDALKVDHRKEEVRGKAESLIRRIKGYRTRGRLTDGVPLKTGRSTIRAVAVEVGTEMPLTWLDRSSADDRILGSVIELMRENPGRAVALITRDINLQNKAEFASVPFLEPPRFEP